MQKRVNENIYVIMVAASLYVVSYAFVSILDTTVMRKQVNLKVFQGEYRRNLSSSFSVGELVMKDGRVIDLLCHNPKTRQYNRYNRYRACPLKWVPSPELDGGDAEVIVDLNNGKSIFYLKVRGKEIISAEDAISLYLMK